MYCIVTLWVEKIKSILLSKLRLFILDERLKNKLHTSNKFYSQALTVTDHYQSEIQTETKQYEKLNRWSGSMTLFIRKREDAQR